jgi:dipeptidase
MKKAIVRGGIVGVAAIALGIVTPLAASACTGIYIGSDFTANGDTYFGRGEDAYTRDFKVFGVQQATTDSGEFYDNSFDGGNFRYPYSATTNRYTYVRDSVNDDGDDLAYAEAGVNEKGVAVTATESINYGTSWSNSQLAQLDPYSPTGITEAVLTSVILGEADSARDAVQLIGSIIDDPQYGAGEGFQIHIGDANETWSMWAFSGHQWIAQKMTDDVMSVNPNMASLEITANLSDPDTCLHSATLQSFAEEQGIAQYFADGTFDVAKTYGLPEPAGNVTRYMQALYYFNPDYADQIAQGVTADNTFAAQTDPAGNPDATVPNFLFTPSNTSMTTQFILNALATRGQGTPFASAVDNDDLYPVATQTQMEAHMFQVRHGMQPDIATVEWLSISRAEFGIYLPTYSALVTEVSPVYADGPTDHSYESAMTENPDVADSYPYTMVDINDLASNGGYPDLAPQARAMYGAGVRQYFDALQASIIEQQDQLDEVMQALPEGSQERTDLANEASVGLANQIAAKAKTLLAELRAHIAADEAAGAATPFTPSDMNADGTVKVPVEYYQYAIPYIPAPTDTDTTDTTDTGAKADDGEELADTGSDVSMIAAVAVAGIVLGGALLLRKKVSE